MSDVQQAAAERQVGDSAPEPGRSRTYTWSDPMVTAHAAATSAGIDFLRSLVDGTIDAPPIAVTLGFDIVEVAEGFAVFSVVPREFHYNPIGVVHGGLVLTILDSALGCAVQSTLPAGSFYTTVETKVNMTRAITADTGRLRCEASVIHTGRRIATAEGRVTGADGRLYAHGTSTCMIDRPSAV